MLDSPSPGLSQESGSSHSQHTIGLLTYGKVDPLNNAVWSGVADAARARGANVIRFVGESLHDPAGFRSQANVLYELVGPDCVHGLVVWGGGLAAYVTPEEVGTFCERYHPLPMVLLAYSLPGIPGVWVDNYGGMRGLVEHLVEVHGHRRIAFIRGPEEHPEAEERYRGYCDALSDHAIAIDPRLVAPGGFSLESGAEAVRLLLEEREVGLDAFVALNDTVALGAMKALQARGVCVPEDVALAGFDDLEEGRHATPPLTSVPFRAYEQGRQAVEMVLDLLAGREVPQRTIVPTAPAIRRSCGCASAAVVQASVEQAAVDRPRVSGDAFEAAFAGRRADALAGLARALTVRDSPADQGCAEPLLDAAVADLTGGASGSFLSLLEEALRQARAMGGVSSPGSAQGVMAWQGAVSELRRHLLPCLDDNVLVQAENLWQQARVVVAEAAQSAQARRHLDERARAALMSEAGQALLSTTDVAELMGIAAQQLPRLGIGRAYVALYEDPASPAGLSRLILACGGGRRVDLDPEGTRFPSRRLLPEGVLSHCEPYALVVEALYFREEQLGFALFEAGPSQEDVCSALRGYLSSALKSALLFRHSADLYEEALQARAAAEKADRLKTRLLANVSHELRTPLNTIIGFADQALGTPETYGSELSPDLLGDLRHIRDSARHLLRVINDLLDLSRAEIDALDLYPEFIEVRPFLEEAFHSIADTQPSEGPVNWGLELPDRLPIIRADPVRVRQVLLNLLSNARKFTDEGEVVLGAEVTPQHLHLWVSDTGIGIPIDRQELVFEPFVTVGLGERRLEGIGLGLSIARRLVLLHGGSLTLESKPGAGSTFHVYLPLPSLSDCPAPSFSESARAVLLVISARDAPAEELVALARRRELEIRSLQPGDDVDETLAGARPAVLAWDLASAGPGEWAVIQRLRQHPRLSQAPFILYAQEGGSSVSLATGLTDFVSKPVGGETLVEAIGALRPREDAGPILIVDDDPEARDLYRGIVEEALPGYVVLAAGNGSAALDLMAQEPPSLVVLDLMMPEMDGFEVLDRMRAGPRTRQVPVLVLSGRMLTLDDVRRFEEHALVTFQSKGILSAEETAAALHRALFGADSLPAHTSALVKRIVAYLQQNHDSAVSRKEVARTIGVSERYLSQVFRRELGLSPWEYLNRLRVARAKELLDCTDESITGVAARVGFTDPSYFGRVFRRLIGCSPSAYRKEGKQ